MIIRQRVVPSTVVTDQYTLDTLAGPARRRPRWIWAAVAAVLVLVAAGLIGIGYVLAGRDEPEAAAAAPTPRANEIECVNIDRAYNSWANARLQSAYEFEAVNEVFLREEIDDQKALLEAVQGYDDQPSKVLATAVAGLGVELAMLNAEMVIGDGVTADQAAKAAEAHKNVRAKYGAWKATTCG